MDFGIILKALPALLGLVSKLFAGRKAPAKRAEDILGGPSEATDAAKAKAAADAAAAEKFNK